VKEDESETDLSFLGDRIEQKMESMGILSDTKKDNLLVQRTLERDVKR
jgi:hypothetical protein